MTLVMQWSPWLQTILIGYNSFVFMSSSHLLLKLFLLLFSCKRLLFIALRIDRYSPRWKYFSRLLLVQAQLRCELTDHEIQYIPQSLRLEHFNSLIVLNSVTIHATRKTTSAVLPTNVRVLLLNLAFQF